MIRNIVADAARTIVPGRDDRHGPLPPLLLLLTVVTGVVDAASYLALGHVFVAQMTGNIVFLGFAIAGAKNFSASGSLVSLTAFLAGALGGGRLGARLGPHRGHLLSVAAAIKVGLVATALVIAAVTAGHLTDPARYGLIGLLALAMGLQSATARKLGVPDLSTVVLTMALAGFAADSGWAGGSAPRPGRRLLAVISMLIGAILGGMLAIHVSIAAALGLATALLLVVGLTVRQLSSGPAPWATAR